MSVAISPDGRTHRHRHAGQHLDDAGGRRRDEAHHRRLQRRAPADVVARWPHHRVLRLSRRRLRHLGDQSRRLEPAQADLGPYDDREPIFSHDGTRIAFSSDRGNALGSDYNIWTLDLRSGELKQITKDASEDFMPTWSPDDNEIVFATSRDNYESLWAMNVRSLGDRRVRSVKGARLDAPSWGPGGQLAVSRHRRRPDALTRSKASR